MGVIRFYRERGLHRSGRWFAASFFAPSFLEPSFLEPSFLEPSSVNFGPQTSYNRFTEVIRGFS
jgi:hypothetical protein